MDDGGFGGAGGLGGGGGGGGGEDIGVAQEADTTCCCAITVSGSMSCQVVAGDCAPYTTSSPGACDAGPPPPGCSASSVRSGTGGAVEMFVLLLPALAAYRAMWRRFARG